MSVYVTVELSQGLVAEVHTFMSRQGGKEQEGRWLAEYDVATRDDHEAMAGHGTEFHLAEADIRP